jgi:hypothetical protein
LEDEQMKNTRIETLVVAVLLGSLIAGCCGGGTTVKSTTPVNVSTIPVGQQLIELQKAYESGAISESEYKKLKQDAIDKSSK